MSNIAIKGATTGTGTFTIESPATNTDRTLTLPDEAGTVVTTASDISGLTGIPAVGSQVITVKPSGDSSTISNATVTKVNFDTREYDPDSLWDTSNYNFTVPSGEGGVYLIGANLVVFSSGSKLEQAILYVYKNNSDVARYRLNKPNTAQPFQHIGGTLNYVANLSAGDVIHFGGYINSNDGTAAMVYSANCRAFIVRIA